MIHYKMRTVGWMRGLGRYFGKYDRLSIEERIERKKTISESEYSELTESLPFHFRKRIDRALTLSESIERLNTAKFMIDTKFSKNLDQVVVDLEKFDFLKFLLNDLIEHRDRAETFFPRYLIRVLVFWLFIKLRRLHTNRVSKEFKKIENQRPFNHSSFFYSIQKEFNNKFIKYHP